MSVRVVGVVLKYTSNEHYPFGLHAKEYLHDFNGFKGKPYRILYAFDPKRTAMLLVGGNKTGKDRWYKKHVPVADKLFREHLKTLDKKGSN